MRCRRRSGRGSARRDVSLTERQKKDGETDEKVDSERNDVEPAEKGESVGPTGRVKTVEEDDRCDEGRRGEADKVTWVDDSVRARIFSQRSFFVRRSNPSNERCREEVERLQSKEFSSGFFFELTTRFRPKLTLLK
jgi:hypothetical protein